jgi:DNA polymerase-3 subunit gamma/tau
MREQELAVADAQRREILDSPMVAAVRAAFPGAELVENQRSEA